MNQLYSYYSIVMYLIYNAFGIYVIYKFNTIFFKNNEVNKKFETIAYISYLFIISIVYEVWNMPIVTVGSNILLCFLVTCIYKENWLKGITLSILINTISFLFESVSYLIILRYSLVNIEFILSFVSTLVTYIFVMTLDKFINRKTDEKLSLAHWMSIFIVPSVSIYVVFILVLSEHKIVYTELGVIGLLIVNFLIFYLYDELAEAFEEKYQKTLLKQNSDAYLNQLELIKNSNDNLRILRHDFKNHILALSSMAKKQENEKIISYLDSMQNQLLVKGNYVCTHNISFDSILNFKLHKANELGADIKIDVNYPVNLHLDDFDITIILGNLLDNAIESIEKCENKLIELSINFQRGILFIDMKNSANNLSDNKYKSAWCTSKKHKLNHGFGLLQIKKSVDKYDGSFDMIIKDNVCETKILMYIKN